MDRRIIKTRASIREAFFSLLRSKEQSRITVAELARTANIDRKTFYLHYQSTEDIVREITGEKVEEFNEILRSMDFFAAPCRVDVLFAAISRLIGNDLEFYRSIANSVNYDFFWSDVREIMENAIIRSYGDSASMDKASFELYARFFVSGVLSVCQSWLHDDKGLSLGELAELGSNIAHFGMQTAVPVEKL